MKLNIKTMTGIYSVDAEPTDSILKIKEKIQDQLGIPPSKQRLLIANEWLEDDNQSVGDIENLLNRTNNTINLRIKMGI